MRLITVVSTEVAGRYVSCHRRHVRRRHELLPYAEIYRVPGIERRGRWLVWRLLVSLVLAGKKSVSLDPDASCEVP